MIQLEKYRGTKSRHICPACNSRHSFVRYVGDDGNYLSETVGRCNRESKCGYHYKPKEFFAEQGILRQGSKAKKHSQVIYQASILREKPKSYDFIPPEHFKATLAGYDQNAFVEFLLNLFPDCIEEVQRVLQMYLVGSFDDYTCFPSIDRLNRICRAKLIRFNLSTGKRLKGEYDTSSLVRKLKLKEDFHYQQTFFGEHLLTKYPNKPVAIVEAEKTAIIASIYLPEFVWLGSNSKTWLKPERLGRLDNRQIILYPDADGFGLWQTIASEARGQGFDVKVSALIETRATAEQKTNGYDLADYLINQQHEINEFNEFTDSYNSKLETVLSDTKLKRDFETILDEQKSIAIYSGGLSEAEAERICTQPENIRAVVLSV